MEKGGSLCPLCGEPAKFIKNIKKHRQVYRCTSCGEEDSKGSMIYSEFEVHLATAPYIWIFVNKIEGFDVYYSEVQVYMRLWRNGKRTGLRSQRGNP